MMAPKGLVKPAKAGRDGTAYAIEALAQTKGSLALR